MTDNPHDEIMRTKDDPYKGVYGCCHECGAPFTAEHKHYPGCSHYRTIEVKPVTGENFDDGTTQPTIIGEIGELVDKLQKAYCPQDSEEWYRLRLIISQMQTGRKFPDGIPTIVCLCGSGRFQDTFDHAEFVETLHGKIVLTMHCNTKDVAPDARLHEHKSALDELHLRKIDLADEVLILNVGGYIGESTRNELNYAISKGKVIRYLEEVKK